MALPGSLGAAGLGEPVGGVLADGVQQPVTGSVCGGFGDHQGLGCEPVDHLSAAVRSWASHTSAATPEGAGEHRQPGKRSFRSSADSSSS